LTVTIHFFMRMAAVYM